MRIFESPEEPETLDVSFDMDESEVVRGVFTERCRNSMLEGDEPDESDLFMATDLDPTKEIKMSGDEGFMKFIKFALDEYARHSMAEAESIRFNMGDMPGAANIAMERFQLGMQAREMAVEIEANTELRQSNFYEQVSSFLEDESGNNNPAN